jgi:hypothetical protein
MEETSKERNKLTLGMVTAGLNFSKLQVRTIFTTILQKSMPADTGEIAHEDLFCLLVADALERISALQPEQRTLLLTELRPVFNVDPATALIHLLFADNRYSTWTGYTGFLDLQSGENITCMPAVPVVSIGYNLSELYRQGVLMLENRNGFHGQKYNAGSVDKSGDVCSSSADVVS